MPIAPRGPRKAMRGKCERGRGKCERGRGSANADGAGAKAFAGDGYSQKASFAPGLRFHGVDRADVYIIIRVRACCCGECALNPPTSQPIPRRRPPLAPAQRHALPEHFRSPTQPRRTPAGCATHSPPKTFARPAQRHALPEHFCSPTQPRRTPADLTTHSPPKIFALPEHFLTPFPRTSAPPRSDDARPPTSQPISRRRSAPAPAQRHALPEPFLTPTQPRRTPAGCAMHSSPTSQPIPRRRPSPAPAQRHALPEHFLTHSPPRRTSRSADAHPQAARCIPRRPHHPYPAESLRPSPHSDTPAPTAPPCLPLRSTSGTKKRHRTVDVRCRMSRSTVVAVGHWGW